MKNVTKTYEFVTKSYWCGILKHIHVHLMNHDREAITHVSIASYAYWYDVYVVPKSLYQVFMKNVTKLMNL